MNRLQKLLATLKARLTSATDAERPVIEEQIRDVEAAVAEAAPAPPTPGPGSSAASAISQEALDAALAPLRKDLTDLAGLLAQERKDREAAQAALTAKVKDEQAAATKKLLDEAIEKGKITAEERTQYEADAAANFDIVQRFLARQPENPAVNRGKQAAGAKGVQQKPGDPAAGGIQGSDGVRPETRLARSVSPAALKYVQDNVLQE